jgi:hypothetical protein
MFNSARVLYTCATQAQINNFAINARVNAARPAQVANLKCPAGFRFSISEVIPRGADFCQGFETPLPAGVGLINAGDETNPNRGYPDLHAKLRDIAHMPIDRARNKMNATDFCRNRALLDRKLLDAFGNASFTVFDLFMATKAARDALQMSVPKGTAPGSLAAGAAASKNSTVAGYTDSYTTGSSDPGYTDALFRKACAAFRSKRFVAGTFTMTFSTTTTSSSSSYVTFDPSLSKLPASAAFPYDQLKDLAEDTNCDSSTGKYDPSLFTDKMPDLLASYVTLVENRAGNFPMMRFDSYENSFFGRSLLQPDASSRPTETWKQQRCLTGSLTRKSNSCEIDGCRSDCCTWSSNLPDCCTAPSWTPPLYWPQGDSPSETCDAAACPTCYSGDAQRALDDPTWFCHAYRCATTPTYSASAPVLWQHAVMSGNEAYWVYDGKLDALDAECAVKFKDACEGKTACIAPVGCSGYNVDYACVSPRDDSSASANKKVAFAFKSTSPTAQPTPAQLRCPGAITVTAAESSRERFGGATITTDAVAGLCQTGSSSCAVPLQQPYIKAGDTTLKVTYSCACASTTTPGYKAATVRVYKDGAVSCVETMCDAGTYRADGMADCKPGQAGQVIPSPGSTSSFNQFCGPGTYAEVPGLTACRVCPPGTYSNAMGGQGCTACPANTYQGSPESSACQVCPAGTTSPVGARECSFIQAGYYRSRWSSSWGSNWGYGDLRACAKGMYSSAASSCVACDPGSYSSAAASTSCRVCPFGTYSSGPVKKEFVVADNPYPEANYMSLPTSCTPCPNGTFTLKLGATSVDNCTALAALDWQVVARNVSSCSELLLFGRPGMENRTLAEITLTRLTRQLGNGYCQGGPFNTAPCGWDGGDCCIGSCVVPPLLNETLMAADEFDPSLLLGACSQQQSACLNPNFTSAQGGAKTARAGAVGTGTGQGRCGNATPSPTSPDPATPSPTTESPTTTVPTSPTRAATDSPVPAPTPATSSPTFDHTDSPTLPPSSDSPTTLAPTTRGPTFAPHAPVTGSPTQTMSPSTWMPSAAPTASPTSARPTAAPSSMPTPTPTGKYAAVGDGRCDAVFNSLAYAYDAGDCDPRKGNSYCDMDLNTELQGWDGGDCCWQTCKTRLGLAGSCMLTNSDSAVCLDPKAADMTTPTLRLYGEPVVCVDRACVDWPAVAAKDDDPCFLGAIDVKDVFSECDNITKNCSALTRVWSTRDAAGNKASLNLTTRVNMAPPAPAPTPAPAPAPAQDTNIALPVGLAVAGAVLVLAAVATAVTVNRKRSAQQRAGSVGVELGTTITAADPV